MLQLMLTTLSVARLSAPFSSSSCEAGSVWTWWNLLCELLFLQPTRCLSEVAGGRRGGVLGLGVRCGSDRVLIRLYVLLALIELETIEQVDHVNELLQLLHLFFGDWRLCMLLGPSLGLRLVKSRLVRVSSFRGSALQLRLLRPNLSVATCPSSNLLAIQNVHLSALAQWLSCWVLRFLLRQIAVLCLTATLQLLAGVRVRPRVFR